MMKANTQISVNGRKLTVLDTHDARRTYCAPPALVGGIVTLETGEAYVDARGQIQRCSEVSAITVLRARTSDPQIVIVEDVPIPGTKRTARAYRETALGGEVG